jgi:hypothetical protein
MDPKLIAAIVVAVIVVLVLAWLIMRKQRTENVPLCYDTPYEWQPETLVDSLRSFQLPASHATIEQLTL